MKFSYSGLVFLLTFRLSSAACGEGETCAQEDDASSMLQANVRIAEERGPPKEETDTTPIVMHEEVDVHDKALSSGQANDPDAAEWVLHHNYYRCIHNTPEIQWDDDVALGSKKHALTGVFAHSKCYRIPAPRGPSGENLAAGQGDIGSAVRAWYNESPERGPGCGGHCTALLWKKSTALGCSKQNTYRGSRPMYVCRYAKTAANYGSKAAGVNAQDMSRECDCYKKYPVPKRWGNGEQCGLPVGSSESNAIAEKSSRGENKAQQSSGGSGDNKAQQSSGSGRQTNRRPASSSSRTNRRPTSSRSKTNRRPKSSRSSKKGRRDWLVVLKERIASTEQALEAMRALVVATLDTETGGEGDLESLKQQVTEMEMAMEEMQGLLGKAAGGRRGARSPRQSCRGGNCRRNSRRGKRGRNGKRNCKNCGKGKSLASLKRQLAQHEQALEKLRALTVATLDAGNGNSANDLASIKAQVKEIEQAMTEMQGLIKKTKASCGCGCRGGSCPCKSCGCDGTC